MPSSWRWRRLRLRRTQKELTPAHGRDPFPEYAPKSPLVLDRSVPQTELRWTSQRPPNCSRQPEPCPSSPGAMSAYQGSAPPKWAQRGHGAAGRHRSQPAPTGGVPKASSLGHWLGRKARFLVNLDSDGLGEVFVSYKKSIFCSPRRVSCVGELLSGPNPAVPRALALPCHERLSGREVSAVSWAPGSSESVGKCVHAKKIKK